MAYCTTAEVVALTGTTLDADTIVSEIVDQAGRIIDAQLTAAGITPPGSGDALKAAALNYSAAGVLARLKADGTRVGSRKIGKLAITDNVDASIGDYNARGRELVAQYIQGQTTIQRYCYIRKVNG